MGNKTVVNGYVETVYKSIPITDKVDIRVLTSESASKSMLIDIRKYSLYGNMFDDIKRPTKKGIKFKLRNAKDIILGLLDILVVHNMLDANKCESIKQMIEVNVKE